MGLGYLYGVLVSYQKCDCRFLISCFDQDSYKIPPLKVFCVLKLQIEGKGREKTPTHYQTNDNSSMLIIAFCFSRNKVLRLLIGEMFTPGDSRLTDIICSNDGHRCNREVPGGPRYSPDFIPSFRESGRSRIPGGSARRAVESKLSSVSSRESTDPDSRNRIAHQLDQIMVSSLFCVPFLCPYSSKCSI